MKINFPKIVENTISTIITATFIGACLIVWNGATTVDTKVNVATESLRNQAEYMTKAVQVIQEEMIQIKSNQNNLITAINEMKQQKSSVYNVDKKENTNIMFKVEDSIPMIEQASPDFIQKKLPSLKH